jgi:hypothetical protein
MRAGRMSYTARGKLKGCRPTADTGTFLRAAEHAHRICGNLLRRTNSAVMRHPGRRFPGVLVQGNTLHSMCVAADAACDEARGIMSDEGFDHLNDLRNHLWSLLAHYKGVLVEHKISLPFVEMPIR